MNLTLGIMFGHESNTHVHCLKREKGASFHRVCDLLQGDSICGILVQTSAGWGGAERIL